MDEKFTRQIKDWLDTEPDKRDYSVGALYLLKLSGNRIMYRNLVARDTPQTREYIEYQLQKYYNFRVADLTHKEVAAMDAQVIIGKTKSAILKNEKYNFRGFCFFLR